MPAERYPTRFQHLYTNVRKLGKVLSRIASRQNGVRDQASCSNSGPQALVMYTDGSVNKDKPGLGFTVKQRTTTIHDENAANTVSTSSLMIVETVTMSSNVWTHPQPRHFHAFIGRYHKRRPVRLRGLVCRLKAEGPRLDSASALLFHQKGCGLWTQSCCDFAPHN